MVIEPEDNVLELRLTGEVFCTAEDPEAKYFIDIIQEWSGVWMWGDLILPEDPSWVADASGVYQAS